MRSKKRWQRLCYKLLREFMWACLGPVVGLTVGLAILSTEPETGSAADGAGHLLLFVGIVFLLHPFWVCARWLQDHDWEDLQEPNPLSGLPDLNEPPS